MTAPTEGPLDSNGLLELVYEELRARAHQLLAYERRGHTLQPTALVHEAFARISQDRAGLWEDRNQFFRAAAIAMRRILVEHARMRVAAKRGGEQQPVTLGEGLDVIPNPAGVLELDDALRDLAEKDPRSAEIVELRYFAGLSLEETAAAMQVSTRTVRRDWEFARAWLFEELR